MKVLDGHYLLIIKLVFANQDIYKLEIHAKNVEQVAQLAIQYPLAPNALMEPSQADLQIVNVFQVHI